jgi:broad specificity phosphatase PhoE
MKGKVYVLRHAVSQHNEWMVRRIFKPSLWFTHDSGIIDAELSPKGIQNAQKVQKTLESVNFDLVICSPLTRAIQTMEIVLQGKNIPTIVTPLVRERIDRLSDTGKTQKYLMEKYPTYKFLHFNEEWKSFDGPDGFEKEDELNIHNRISQFKEYLKGLEFETMLLVTHAHFIYNLTTRNLIFPNGYFWIINKSTLVS